MTFRHHRTRVAQMPVRAFIIAVSSCLLLIASLSAGDSPWAADGMFSSPFGIGGCHVRNRHAADNATWVPEMAAIGLQVFRTPQAGWGALEPEEGKWRWDEFDKQVQYLQDQKFEFGVMLYGNAPWNKLDKPGTLPV